jgi:glucose-1-phosphate thymidylyltransferase
VAGYLREQVAAYLNARSGPRVRLVIQERLLGNGHAVYAARASLQGPVLILFGDTIFRGDLRRALGTPIAAVGVTEVRDGRTYGIVETDPQGRIRRLWEKPDRPPTNLAVAGVFYFPQAQPLRTALEDLVRSGGQRHGEFWFVDAVQLMIDRGEPVTTFPVERFYDCGTVERLLAANRDLLAEGKEIQSKDAGGWSGSRIIAPCAIDPGAVLVDSDIGPFVTVAPSVRLIRARIRDAVVHPGAVVENATIEGAIVDGPPPQG